MKVKALTTFGSTNDKGRIHISAGDVFELPEGVDWIKAGLVEPVEEAQVEEESNKQ